MAVRLAEPADAGEVARLLGQLGHALPGGDPAWLLANFLGAGEQVLVAASSPVAPGQPLLGVATLHVTPVLHKAGPVGRITALVVDAPARGLGAGRALVAAAEAFFTSRHCAYVEVTSNKSRADAHAFYERLGYAATSVRFGKALPPRSP